MDYVITHTKLENQIFIKNNVEINQNKKKHKYRCSCMTLNEKTVYPKKAIKLLDLLMIQIKKI